MSTPIKVLAIDDENYMLKILQVCLKEPEYKLTICQGSDSAMTMFKSDNFDIVLLDVVMPGINGFELHSMIRALDLEIPIIMLTARVDDVNGIMLKKISSDKNTYYQSKVFTKAVLASKVTQIVSEVKNAKQKDAYFSEMEHDLKVAGKIQRYLFPKWCEFESGFEISYYYKPYQNITGDIFNMSYMDDSKALVVVGDISGHGIQAALYISALRLGLETMLRKTPNSEITPHYVFNYLQALMHEISSDRYMTCIACIVDFKNLTVNYQSAGHPDFIIYTPSKDELIRPDYKGNGAIPVGMLADNVYFEKDNVELHISSDSILFFYSDGLTDLTNEDGTQLGSNALCEFVKLVAYSGSDAALAFKLMEAIYKIGFSDSKDDVAIATVCAYAPKANEHEYLIRPMLDDADECAQKISTDIMNETEDQSLASKAEIVASEFINNIIVHGIGNRNLARPMIYVSLTFEPDSIKLLFYDKGKAWNDLNSEVDSSYADILNKKSADSGRGMAMIRDIASSVLRNRFANTLNETVITIKR